MTYFERYRANTCAGGGNQLFFSTREGETYTGRVFYRVTVPGSYTYSLLFSNIIDSTYADGSISHANLPCEGWELLGARIGRAHFSPRAADLSLLTVADEDEYRAADIRVSPLVPLTFSGSRTRRVAPGERFFASDPVRLSLAPGEYLCLELTVSGQMIPYHEESLLPIYHKTTDGWRYDRRLPLPSMIGCDRPVKGKIAFLGDSITQGIGAPANSYLHWNARLAEMLGDRYAFWNLGIGYGRASDLAADGVWMDKALQNDLLIVCYGVNDILQGRSADALAADLAHIVDRLKAADKTVILQTVPPFDYTGEHLLVWRQVNEYIRTVLAKRVDAVFDTVPFLGSLAIPQNAKYGGHPSSEGSAIWARALLPVIVPFL